MVTLVFGRDSFMFKLDVEYVGPQVNLQELNDLTNAFAEDMAGQLGAEFMYTETAE